MNSFYLCHGPIRDINCNAVHVHSTLRKSNYPRLKELDFVVHISQIELGFEQKDYNTIKATRVQEWDRTSFVNCRKSTQLRFLKSNNNYEKVLPKCTKLR